MCNELNSIVLNKILANLIQQYIKKIIPHDQVSYILGIRVWYIHKSINEIYHLNKLKDRNLMIMSIDSEKATDKIEHPSVVKTLSKVGIQETCLNKIKSKYNKITANIILNRQKLKVFPLRSGINRDVCFQHSSSTQNWKFQPHQQDKKKKPQVHKTD